jgi:hypothetical protein
MAYVTATVAGGKFSLDDRCRLVVNSVTLECTGYTVVLLKTGYRLVTSQIHLLEDFSLSR